MLLCPHPSGHCCANHSGHFPLFFLYAFTTHAYDSNGLFPGFEDDKNGITLFLSIVSFTGHCIYNLGVDGMELEHLYCSTVHYNEIH